MIVPAEQLNYYIEEIEEKMENIDEYGGSLEYAALQKLFNYELYKDFTEEVAFQKLLDDYEEEKEYFFFAYI